MTLQISEPHQNARPSKSVCYAHSEELLGIIDDFLHAEKITPQHLKRIKMVNSAPTFTIIRNVITVLNTMAWALHIPLQQVDDPTPHNDYQPLAPHYSAPPTITLPKKKKE